MTSRSPLARFAFVLCIFAVLGAQVFGVVRGFVCDCGGSMQLVQTSDCHGPHSAQCHEEGTQQTDCSDDEENSDDRKEHRLVKDDLLGDGVMAHSIAVPAATVLAVLPRLLLFAPAQSAAKGEYLSDSYGGSPLSIAVSHTVVLRI